MNVKLPVCKTDRAGSNAAVVPFDGAGCEFDALQRLTGSPIKIIPYLYRTTDRGGIFRPKIQLFLLDFAIFDRELDRAASGAGRANINDIIRGEWCGNVGLE